MIKVWLSSIKGHTKNMEPAQALLQIWRLAQQVIRARGNQFT
jgi:hypothetical protein